MMDKETMCERWRDELRKCSRHCDYVVAGMLAHEDFANSKKERFGFRNVEVFVRFV